MTDRTGLPAQDCQGRTARIRQSEHDCQDGTARKVQTGLPGKSFRT
jgi:hypothetical protein